MPSTENRPRPHTSTSLRPFPRALALLVGATLSVACFAQNTPEPLKNFKKYPDGQWTQELKGETAGQSATPMTSQGCKTPADPQSYVTASKLNSAFAALCNTVKVADTERMFEYEQTCKLGATGSQVTHITGRVVDDRTMTVDTRLSIKDRPDTLMHSRVTYTGAACQAPTVAKASAAECAQVASMQARSTSGADVCASMPAQYRSQCEVRLAAAGKAQSAVAERCK